MNHLEVTELIGNYGLDVLAVIWIPGVSLMVGLVFGYWCWQGFK